MAQSNTATTRTTIDNILKEVYGPAIWDWTKAQVVALELFETTLGDTGPWGGQSFIFPLEQNYLGSTAAMAETDDLPNSTPLVYVQSVVPIYTNAFSVSATGLAMATTGRDVEAFAPVWQREVAGKTRSFRQNINRQMNGDGNAILCQVDGAPAVGGTYTTVTLDNAYGQSGFNNSDVNGARFITPNMELDFQTGATVRTSGNDKVYTVTKGVFPSTSAYITVINTAVTGITDGDYVYVAGSYGNEFPGLDALIDDGTTNTTFQSISTDTYPDWKAWVHYGTTAGTAEPWTTSRMTNLVDDIESYGGGMVDAFVTSNDVFFTIGEIMRSEGLITNPEVLDTGWTVMKFAGKPIYKDPFSLPFIYAVDKRAIKLMQAQPAGWIDYDGLTVRQDGTKNQWTASYWWPMTPAVMNRQWVGKMEDISVTVNKW